MSPGHLDEETIRRHLLALDRAMQNLRRHAGKPAEVLGSDLDEAWAVERGLQICVQCVLDIATHVAASSGRDTPDYASAIDQLASLDILPAFFTSRFRAVAGFRNILVHGYLEVDLEEVHRLLNERLSDFVEFATLVQAYLDKQ